MSAESPSLLKKIISYFFELPVESGRSAISGEIKVTLLKGKYCLSTENAVYSYGDQYSSFKTAFKKTGIENRPLRNSLILGYGLGSIPQILNNQGIHPQFTAVELDPVVINLAEKYGYLPVSVALIQEDAYRYVLHSTQKFDLINADLYIDDTTPPQFEKIEFLAALKNLLNPGGLLLFSRFYYDSHHRQHTDEFQRNVFEKVFPGSYAIPTRGNMMLAWEG